MPQQTGHRIKSIQAGSIAGDLGLRPGDFLELIDGQPVGDLFDYQMRQASGQLLLSVRQAGGERVEFDIEKDEDEDLGIVFEKPLLDDVRVCQNRCVFCFIDQLPDGLRPSLYVKDDDARLSFLSGNYVTLTNLDEPSLAHLIERRLSPVNVSVHSSDPLLRQKMLGHRRAGQIMEQLTRIAAAGLAINAQIVLCPGFNDGAALERTLSDLAALGPALQSVAVVPVGLTRFRAGKGLPPLQPLSAAGAQAVLGQVTAWQEKMIAERQTRLVYAADEIYLKAGAALPPAADYEDFPQLENGVGMAALLIEELSAGLTVPAAQTGCREPLLTAWPRAAAPDGASGAATHSAQPEQVVLVSGIAASPLLAAFQPGLSAWSGLPIAVAAIENCFFGEQVTVAGLLTGQDLLCQLPQVLAGLPGQSGAVRVILPACQIKDGTDRFLDDSTVQSLADGLGAAVHVCTADGPSLLGLLAWLRQEAPAKRAKQTQAAKRGKRPQAAERSEQP
jgi:putative radical SAM enzyme (TIGR03279 family)